MIMNQMEEACISRQRNKAIARIIERYPHRNLRIEGDGCVLRVDVDGSSEVRSIDAADLGVDWSALMQTVRDFGYYDRSLPDHGSCWTLSHKS